MKKKLFLVAISGVVVLSVLGCSGKEQEVSNDNTVEDDMRLYGNPEPSTEVESVVETQKESDSGVEYPIEVSVDEIINLEIPNDDVYMAVSVESDSKVVSIVSGRNASDEVLGVNFTSGDDVSSSMYILKYEENYYMTFDSVANGASEAGYYKLDTTGSDDISLFGDGKEFSSSFSSSLNESLSGEDVGVVMKTGDNSYSVTESNGVETSIYTDLDGNLMNMSAMTEDGYVELNIDKFSNIVNIEDFNISTYTEEMSFSEAYNELMTSAYSYLMLVMGIEPDMEMSEEIETTAMIDDVTGYEYEVVEDGVRVSVSGDTYEFEVLIANGEVWKSNYGGTYDDTDVALFESGAIDLATRIME